MGTTSAEFTRIPIAALAAIPRNTAADVALYLDEGPAPVLYRRAGSDGPRPDFQRLREHGVASLLVRGEQFDQCERLLEEELSSVLARPEVAPEQKAEYIHHVGASVARDLARQTDAVNIDRVSTVLDEVIDCILTDPAVADCLLQVAAHDCSTASHMFAVSTLAIVLGARTLGPDPDLLKPVGLAGMMHDLGKLTIPQEVLTKPSSLSPHEVQLIQQHPIESVRLIGEDPRFTRDVRQMILQHHERIDGRGYPLGLCGEDLLPGSKILAIVDSFHAMIGQRPYRARLTAGQAVRAMSCGVGKQFDPELFAAWESIIRGSWPDALTEITHASEASQNAHEHRDHAPFPQQRKVQGRAARHVCHGRIQIECLYSGRLPRATAAPDRFVSPVHDISRSGVCLFTTEPLYGGETLHLLVRLPSGPTWVCGRVAWCRREPGGAQLSGRHPLHRQTYP